MGGRQVGKVAGRERQSETETTSGRDTERHDIWAKAQGLWTQTYKAHKNSGAEFSVWSHPVQLWTLRVHVRLCAR